MCLISKGEFLVEKKFKGRKERKKERKMIQLLKPGREVESVTIISWKQVTLGEGWWLEPPLGSK